MKFNLVVFVVFYGIFLLDGWLGLLLFLAGFWLAFWSFFRAHEKGMKMPWEL